MKNLLKTWNWLEKTLGGVLAFGATMCIFYGVIMRYVFSSSPEWVEEVVIYMIVWAVFIIGLSAFLTIAVHIYRTLTANPADTLRDE